LIAQRHFTIPLIHKKISKKLLLVVLAMSYRI
jgi:hypothetical protein